MGQPVPVQQRRRGRRRVPRPERGLNASLAHLVAWGVVGLISAVIGALDPQGAPGLVVAAACGIALGQALTAGLLSAAVAEAVSQSRPDRVRCPITVAALLLAAALVAQYCLRDDVSVRAGRLPAYLSPRAWRTALSLVIAICPPLAFILSIRLRRLRGARAVLIVGALALAAGHGFVLPLLYPGVHLVAAWTSALVLGAALTGASCASWPRIDGRPQASGEVAPAGDRRAPAHRLGRGMWALSGVAALVALACPISPGIDTALARQTAYVFAPFWPRFGDAEAAPSPLRLTSEEAPWYANRDALPTRPPSSPGRTLPGNAQPMVVLVTIDTLRADVAHDPAAPLPRLRALAAQSVDFTRARTTALSTHPALASLYTGRYYSQLFWRPHTDGLATRLYPTEDATPRVAELLTAAGVATAFVAPDDDLMPDTGVTRGFAFALHPQPGYAPEMVDAALDWLGRHSQSPRGPALLAMHLIDAHSPYDRGGLGTETTPRERWLAELATVDVQLGRLLDGIDRLGLADRAVVIISADHGEAFGEHGGRYHGTLLIEPVLKIPLFIRFPGVAPRVDDTEVSLIDLGPTLLDLFGVDTPAAHQGQSLLPRLRGEPAGLTRPLVVDAGRRLQAMYFGDGLKMTLNLRLGRVELFDLHADPDENLNLYRPRNSDHAARLQRMRAFFEVHEARAAGYETPHRE